MSAAYEDGEVVDITIAGARVTNTYVRTDHTTDPATVEQRLVYQSQDGNSGTVTVDAPGITIERVAPAEWPPQPGDVWARGEGRASYMDCGMPASDLWLCVREQDYDNGRDEIVLLPAIGDRGYVGSKPEYVLRASGPLRLVYRPGGTP